MNKIIKILGNIRPDIDFATTTSLQGNNGLDSLDLIRLVSDLESTYNISISGADMTPENFSDLKSIENLVSKLKAP